MHVLHLSVLSTLKPRLSEMISDTESQLMNAATIVCLRHVMSGKSQNNRRWEVLLGQNEVKNWLRSTPETTVIMRYPGEWKLPGGVKDVSDQSLRHTAVRELCEEFIGISCPDDILSTMLLINKKITMAIKGKQYCMHNFVAFDESCLWNNEEIAKVNLNLQVKRSIFETHLKEGTFWDLSDASKYNISPEVHSIAWVDLDDAISMMASAQEFPLRYVNEWQEQQFSEYSISQRDPMYQTMMILQEIKDLGTIEAIKAKAIAFERLQCDV